MAKRQAEKRKGGTPHWLDKAEPDYATSNDLWRVRISRKGQKFNWWLQGGKRDPSSTGKILAIANWNEIKQKVIADESGIQAQLGVQPDGSFKIVSDDIFDEEGKASGITQVETYGSKEEYNRVLRRQIYRSEYLSSPFADSMSLDDYLDWLDFKGAQKRQRQLPSAGANSPTPPIGPKTFSHLLDAFDISLRLAQEGTIKGLEDDEAMGKSRLEQYQFSISHIRKNVGDILCEPLGTYAISELQLESVLESYRAKCKKEVAEYLKKGLRGRGVHWFNEKMKAARKLTTFLTENRLCNGLPAGIRKVTKKFKIKAKAHPIPLPILRAIWKVADDKFKTFMLLALNLGFRQTEISLLDWDEQHVVVEAGTLIVDKDRGKTGVPIKIPLWDVTYSFVQTNANKSGKFFVFEGEAEKAAIECIGKRWNKLTRRAAKTEPEATKYHFENLRDTGASFLRTQNPFLVPLYLGQTIKGDQAMYISEIKDANGKGIVPMFLDKALENLRMYLNLEWSLV